MIERIEKLESGFEDMTSSLNEVLKSMELMIASQNIHGKQISRIFDGIKEEHEEPSILDNHKDRIEQILSHMTVNGDMSYIGNDDHSLGFQTSQSSKGRSLNLFLFENERSRPIAKITDFEITEGPISSAKMGDLFVVDFIEAIAPSKLDIIGMRDKEYVCVNYLSSKMLDGTSYPLDAQGLIFSPVHKG